MKKIRSFAASLSLPQRIGVVLLLVVISAIIVPRFRRGSSAAPHRISKGEVVESIVISGNANAADNAKVFSPTTGIVEELYVKNGDSVTAGTELLKVKSTAMENEKAAMLAQYQAAVASLNAAKQTKISLQSSLESGRTLVINTSIAKQQMDERRNEGGVNPATGEAYKQDEIDGIVSAYESAKIAFAASEKKYLDADASIAAAQSALNAALLEYQASLNGVIKAPVSGVVANLAVDTGDYVRAKFTNPASTAEGDPVLRILAEGGVTVMVKLNEIDISKVKTGQLASVRFDAFPEKEFPATVARVDTVGENENAVVTYKAYVALTDANDDRVRPSMTATVVIETDRLRDVLVVPNSALTRTEQGKTAVRRLQGNSEVTVPVTVGKKNGSITQILDGVNEGDMILIPSAE